MSQRVSDLQMGLETARSLATSLEAAIALEERRSDLEPKRDQLLADVQASEQRLAALRSSITDAEAHKARIEQDIRQGQVKQSEIEKELVALRRRLTEATAR